MTSKKRQVKKEIIKLNPLKIGEFVVFNTQHGKMTGIIELIYLERKTYKQKAKITARTFSNKPLRYTRYLYQLERLWNGEYL